MAFTPTELAEFSITLPREHAQQVAAKATKYRLSREDVAQELSVLCLEIGPKYDPAKGTLCQFLFGHLDKRLRRQLGPHTFAFSLDRENLDESFRVQIENIAVPSDDDLASQPVWDRPGVSKLSSIANFVSGKSSCDLSRALGVTPRRIRQILQQLREEQITSTQFELGLEEIC